MLITKMEFTRRLPIFIEDSASTELAHYFIPAHYTECLDSILITHGNVLDRAEKLAFDIFSDNKGQTVHFLCVLKGTTHPICFTWLDNLCVGASTFFQDLSRAYSKFHNYERLDNIPFTFDFVRVKSYEGTGTTGTVSITGCDVEALKDKRVIIVEDIVDTGLTMTRLIEFLMGGAAPPASIRVAACLEKRTTESCGYFADYVGFSIPDKFVVGYCLDYNQVFREMDHICVVNQVGIDRYRNAGK